MLTFVLVTLALALAIAWALVRGVGNPRPQVESAWDVLARMGIEMHVSPYVPPGQALIFDRDRALTEYLIAARLGYAVKRPTAFVITNIGA